MKRLIYILFAVNAILANNINAQQVIVTDDSGYTTPATGAMLDVKSTNKGFMLPRVALTSLTDQTTVASPATGLMVYNTGTGGLTEKGIYFWNGTVWEKELTAGTSSTNFVKIAGDGTVTLNGSATTFTDLVVPPYAARNSSSTTPDWVAFLTGTIGFETFAFDRRYPQKQLFFNIQLPHDYKIGSDLYPHVHWSATAAPGTTRVVWKLECQWVNHQATFSNAPANTTTITGYQLAGDNTRSMLAYEHVITPLGSAGLEGSPISGDAKGLSSMLVCRLTRVGDDDSTNDTFSGLAYIISFDLHYEIDSFGSSAEYVK